MSIKVEKNLQFQHFFNLKYSLVKKIEILLKLRLIMKMEDNFDNVKNLIVISRDTSFGEVRIK